MAHSFPTPPQTAMTHYVQDPLQIQEPSQLPSYSIFGPVQFPESVALWHSSSAAQQPPTPAPVNPPSSLKQPPVLQPATDQKKHKRTRSGCFTCRSRRIKCDESRPVCDRCKKGNRECVYPSSAKQPSRSAAKPKGTHSQSQESDSSPQVDQDDVRPLETIADEEEGEEESVGSGSRPSPSSTATNSRSRIPEKRSMQSLRKRKTRQAAETSLDHKDSSSSPSTDFDSLSMRSGSIGQIILEPFGLRGNNQLSEDLRFYLLFHQEFLNHHHYFQKQNSETFIRQGLIDLALQYEPLLYAVVGFAAYHHSLQTATGKLSTFLKYYNKALSLLRKSLGSGENHSEATLVTILVLTTFEECIGDLVNLIDHHQAAHALVRELMTPESINLNELHTYIFIWYARFDVSAGLLGGNETVLSRDWYISKEEYDAEQATLYPDDVQKQLAYAMSIIRRSGLDMASLYAKLSRGLISIDEFVVQNDDLSRTMDRVKDILQSYEGSEYSITFYPNQIPLTDDDVVNPYVPGGLYQGPLWGVNFTWMDYLGTVTMFKYQSSLVLGYPPMAEMESLAMEQCRLAEAVERWPQKENGYIISFKNSIALSALFLPKDEKHTMWCRRKLAMMEQNGYIHAPKLRTALAAVWQAPEITHWWLRNDEGYLDVVREVRAMTEERTNNPRDQYRVDVRDMKSVFGKLNLDDTDTDTSPSSTSHSGYQ